MTIPRVLVIAGSDSGGGAGVQADIKTVTAFGCYATTAITAITAQNTLGVSDVLVLDASLVVAQIDAILSDIGADAIKIGMIGSHANAHAVADRLALTGIPIIFDPVMIATSGATLADDATITAFKRLMAMATLITPNIPELDVLASGGASVLAAQTGSAVLAKGGHGEGDRLVDRLVMPGGFERVWEDARIDTVHTHGTGCTLASGVAAGLAAGRSLEEAVDSARRYVRSAILAAPGLGSGKGPLGNVSA